MFPRWQVLCNRIDLHIKASKTLWKQMSGKLFTLIQILQGEGFQNIFLKHGLAVMEQRLGWAGRTFAAPFCHYTCVGGRALGPLLLPGHSKGSPRQGWMCCWHTGEPAQGAEPRAGEQHGGTLLSPRGSHLGHPQSAQFAHSTNPATEKPPEMSNIPHYVAFTTKIAACTAQAPPELSNKIWNPAPLAWDAQIFCNS